MPRSSIQADARSSDGRPLLTPWNSARRDAINPSAWLTWGCQLGAILAAVVLVLAVVTRGMGLPPKYWAIGGILLGILTAGAEMIYLHQIAQQERSLLMDQVIQNGLKSYGVLPTSSTYDACARSICEHLQAWPAYGFILSRGLTFMLIFLCVTEWAWSLTTETRVSGTPPREAGGILAAKPLPVEDSLAHVRKQVAGPAIGLMLAGLLGVAPLVLMCVVAPFFYWFLEIPSEKGPAVGLSTAPTIFSVAGASGNTTLSLPVVAGGMILAESDAPHGAETPTWMRLMLLLVIPLLLQIPVSILMILGGSKMRRLEAYGLSVIAAVAALLPLSPAFVVSLPMGIWALVTLSNREVRDAFKH